MNKPHVLVLGAGSAGKRHLRNLASLDCDVSTMDPREDRLEEAGEQVQLLNRYESLEQALNEADKFDGVGICSPPKFHVKQAKQALEEGLPVMLEKPVSPDLNSALELKETVQASDAPLLLGYTYRWWPPLQDLKSRLPDIGKKRHARFVMSAHLADWHPWEDYREFFMASKDLGGGALLDESHFIDVMNWFFGVPETLFGRCEKISDLEITSDDNVDMICTYEDGFRQIIHLDLIGRPHEKSITVVGEEGTLQCLFDPNVLRYSGEPGKKSWEVTEYDAERNDMFLGVAEEFVEILNGGSPKTCTINDGINALRCVEAVRDCTTSGEEVSLQSY